MSSARDRSRSAGGSSKSLGRVHAQDGTVGQTHPIHETPVARGVEECTRGFAPVEAHARVGALALEVVEFPEHHGRHDDFGARERVDDVRVVEQRVRVDDVRLGRGSHV